MNLFPKIDKNRQKKIAGLRPATPAYGAAPLPSTQVCAKYLAAVVLDNQDRALLNHVWYFNLSRKTSASSWCKNFARAVFAHTHNFFRTMSQWVTPSQCHHTIKYIPKTEILFPCWNSQSFHLHSEGVSPACHETLHEGGSAWLPRVSHNGVSRREPFLTDHNS